jgi:hypothetical protein
LDGGLRFEEPVVTAATSSFDGGVQFVDFQRAGASWRVTLGTRGAQAPLVTMGETIGIELLSRLIPLPAVVGDGKESRVVLRRGAEPIAFAASGELGPSSVAVPDLSAAGLSVQQLGRVCSTSGMFICVRAISAAGVAWDGGAHVAITPGSTESVGPFDITVESFEALLAASATGGASPRWRACESAEGCGRNLVGESSQKEEQTGNGAKG